MAFKYHPDGTITTETVQELEQLIRLQRRLSAPQPTYTFPSHPPYPAEGSIPAASLPPTNVSGGANVASGALHTTGRGALQAQGATVSGNGFVSDTPLALKDADTAVKKFLTRLSSYVGQTVNSETMKDIMGVESKVAVGPRLRGLRKDVALMGGDMDAYLVPIKSYTGHTSWHVENKLIEALSAIEKAKG